MDLTKFEYGLEIIEGLPGSGKSYYAVRRLIRVIKKYKRPVYTNLPLIFPVVRQYLRIYGGEELASLIRPLKQEHWLRFLQRQHAYSQFKSMREGQLTALSPELQHDLKQTLGLKQSQLNKQPKVTPDQMVQWFDAKVGPPKYEGSDADSIPLSAIIIIDEVQHWHPMIKQGQAEGRLELQAYLTMMRHHLHWIWVITQDRSRIDIVFRKMCKSVVQVRDRGMDRLTYGIRFKHFGVRGQGYRRYLPEQLEGSKHEDQKPIENFTLIPSLPWNSIYFRLYTSWTQAGSKRQIKKTLERVRNDAGITETTAKRKKHIIMRRPKFIKGLYNLLHKLMICAVCVALGLVIATINTKPKEPETREQIQTTNTITPEPHNWPTYDGFAGTEPIFSGDVYSVGEPIGDRGRLVFVHPTLRSCVLIADGGYWLWEYGAQRPNPIGPVDQIRTAYQRLKESDSATSPTIQNVGSNTGN